MKQWIPATLIGLGLTLSSQAALKVMAIGDSMTREYAIQLPFSAPDSDPIEANTMNWVEILAARRSVDIDFGDYKDLGHEYNFGISGYDTDLWMEIIHAGLLDPEILIRYEMRKQYDEVDVIVITNYYGRRFRGGNDFVKQVHTWGKPVIVLTNSPYPFTVAPEYQTVICTYGCSHYLLEKAAQIIYGRC